MNTQQNNQPEFKTLVEQVDLPSEGLFYPLKEGEQPISKVYVEHMTAIDEELLQTPSLIKSGEVFNTLLKRKIKEKNINVEDLLVGDKNAILMNLRITSYGPYYPVKVVSPYTNEEFEEQVDLTKLKHKKNKVARSGVTEEGIPYWEYNFNLNGKSHVAKVKLLSSKEEDNIAKVLGDNPKSLTSSPRMERYKRQIIELDNNNDKGRIASFYRHLSVPEADKFAEFLDKIEPAVDMSYEFTCPSTGSRFRDKVYLGLRFLYPKSRI